MKNPIRTTRPAPRDLHSLSKGQPLVHGPTSQNHAGELVARLRELRQEDAPRVGQKAAHLGELLASGIDVPRGFAVTAEAMRRFLEENRLRETIDRELAAADADAGESEANAGEQASRQASRQAAHLAVRQAVHHGTISWDLAAAVSAMYRELCQGVGVPDNVPVAVRCSPLLEGDGQLAGDQAGYLNIQGADDVVEHVRKCWASLFTAQSLAARRAAGIPDDAALIGVVVQRMAHAESAGVCFTRDPIGTDPSVVVVESTWGLGESVTTGKVEPDRYVVDRTSLHVVDRRIAHKATEHLPSPNGGLTVEDEIPPERRDAPSLTDHQAIQVATVALRIERVFGGPQQVEFAVEPRAGGRRLLVVEAKPLGVTPPGPAAAAQAPGLPRAGRHAAGQSVAGP